MTPILVAVVPRAQETTMNGAAPSPIRVKTLLVAFGVVVALAALLGMLLGAGGSSVGDVQEVSGDSQYYDDGSSSDSQFYESGSIVRGDDGEFIYSDDNGNSVSFGG
jgi:hypothetical protein